MKYLFVIVALLAFTLSNAQGLDSNAVMIKSSYPADFQNSIGRYAKYKFGTDTAAVTREINIQCDALMSLVKGYDEGFKSTLEMCVFLYGDKGHEKTNKAIWDKMAKFNLADAIKLQGVDWDLVQMRYYSELAEYEMMFGF